MPTPRRKYKRPKGEFNLEEIGEILSITSERARQLLDNAEKKMKREALRLGLTEDDYKE